MRSTLLYGEAILASVFQAEDVMRSLNALCLLALACAHFLLMAHVTAAGLELSWGLAPHLSVTASVAICLVPTIGYAIAAYFAVALLEWSLLAGIGLFALPSILWIWAMWTGTRQN